MSKKSVFSGRSISSIVGMSFSEFAQLSKTELRQAVSRLASAANKRLKRLTSSGVVSQALYDVTESGGKFTTKGKGLDELRAEFSRVRDFLESPSSTVKGAKEIEKNIAKDVKSIFGVDFSPTQIRDIINDYIKTQNYDSKYQAQRLRYAKLYSKPIEVYSTDEKEDIKNISEQIVGLFERRLTPEGLHYDGVSQWFDV